MLIKVGRNPLGLERNMYKKGSFELEPGVTILVGCNGAGKTTLLREIKDFCNENDIDCIHYDNHTQGRDTTSAALYRGNIELAATSMISSEGENIIINLGQVAGRIGTMMRRLPEDVPVVILLDAVGSGFSIDNIMDIKTNLFKMLFEYNKSRDLYIVVSTNEFEFAYGERCLDVQNMKYKTFKTYDSYKKFILKSREIKNKRDYGED